MDLIVVGIGGAETAKDAARQAVELAAALGAKVHFVTAVDPEEPTIVRAGSDEWQFSNLESARTEVKQFIHSLGADIEHTVAAVEGPPAKVLVGEAERLGADLIVVGNVRMQGLGRLLGSVGNDVAHTAPCSVLILKTV